MKFRMYHENYNVLDLNRSLEFYEKALGLTEQRRKRHQTALTSSFLLEMRKRIFSWN